MGVYNSTISDYDFIYFTKNTIVDIDIEIDFNSILYKVAGHILSAKLAKRNTR